ncbi:MULTISPECIES: LysR family transcriptional regulator [unclassified Lentimicrobium]|uniref:LysR family transcriptional regulator n=1 Tax=unclassified Lentimicrobium TaxID=2677434 RepID=UPI0015562F8F|nr:MULTISPECIES: LysR family transcriptional regulator [unclassified Lentimicrobium]NPD47767.1 LysR family transcriptional regulator [Lentimicrobium sp. S6]NPD86660.1 LysR family transcriptional regulator [Lentimicrobium sp. L6]
MVNLEWYRTYKAIYDKGTLTAAAEALFISQPGVSLHLSSLENHVGTKLFDRVAKKMVATEQGKVLYNALYEPLLKLEEIEKRFQKSTELEVPTINIGMCFETFQHILERHLHTLNFNIISSFSDYQNLLKDLEKGFMDVVITPKKIDIKGIVYEPIASETIVLIGSADIDKVVFTNEIKKRSIVDLKLFLREKKWYGASSDNEHTKRFWQANFNSLPDFRANYIVPNFKSIINSLSYGSGLAIVPDFLCQKEIENNKLQLLWKGNSPIVNKLYFAYRKNSIYKKQLDKILNIFKEEMS